jgi:inner membrane protein
MSVGFIDPINPYVLSDRAVKYGLLFVALTFIAVGLIEVLSGRRVHPVQYLLVGLALSLFFLLLLSLSEHLAFEVAYAAASCACAALLAVYASAMLGRSLHGLAFGAGIALLYGLLYTLLQMEQNALVIGSVMLFAGLATVMLLTRRIDWYALFARLGAPGEPASNRLAP